MNNAEYGLAGLYDAEAAAGVDAYGFEPFDICLPRKGQAGSRQKGKALRNVGKSSRAAERATATSAARAQRAAMGADDLDAFLDMPAAANEDSLPPGLVLLNGWLSPE